MPGFYSRVVFPRLMDFVMSRPYFGPYRAAALADVEGEALEIGFGTGLNIPYYPGNTKALTAIDVNEGVMKIAMKRIESSAMKVEYRRLDGAKLPMDDETFDSVVSVCALCSIADVSSALQEASRVLRPGGRFFFLEHGLSDDPKARKWQHRLTPLQKIIADGCHLDRDIESLVAGSGLEISKMDKFIMSKSAIIPRTIRHMGQMYLGVAVKR